jgi:hypothetical protein
MFALQMNREVRSVTAGPSSLTSQGATPPPLGAIVDTRQTA